mgnify:FL=1
MRGSLQSGNHRVIALGQPRHGMTPFIRAPQVPGTRRAQRSDRQRHFAPLGIRVIEAVPPRRAQMTAGRGKGKLPAREMAKAIRDGVASGRSLVAPRLSTRVPVLNRLVPELVRCILSRNWGPETCQEFARLPQAVSGPEAGRHVPVCP